MSATRRIDALVAEIGSTTTVVSAFDGLLGWPRSRPLTLGQGTAPTSVAAGDVTLGLLAARAQLEAATGPLAPDLVLATSSAAGGLRMTVHGLTMRMTAAAAHEAALGAGAVVKLVTAGRLRDADLRQIDSLAPNLLLLAGGVDGGDVETVLYNAGRLAELCSRPLVVYGGNSSVADEVRELLLQAGFAIRVTTNVYPAVDELDIVPARTVIHDAFEEHIIHAPGMERIREIVAGGILPTPGAALISAEALAAEIGDLVVIDVGGATTDVHSVTEGSAELAAVQTEPQPHAKRTVEGDLGTFVSAEHVAAMLPPAARPRRLPPALPASDEEITAALALARHAAVTAVTRHAGRLVSLYTSTGRTTVVRGRDLTACRWVIGTGGALTRLPGGREILTETLARDGGEHLLPPRDATCLLDDDYILAACGALLAHFPAGAVVALLRASLGMDELDQNARVQDSRDSRRPQQ